MQMLFVPIEWVTMENFLEVYGFLWLAFIWVTIAIFLVNVFLNFNVGFYAKG